ncbi:hypothetical protein UPYG_G00015860 [Umbra pygmaea]|uniref:Peptidase S1 domain-containing protein n=1 Tax=Umbra pygmaea TaxID=75934 RepID=A0ABD0XMA6_UMBPY
MLLKLDDNAVHPYATLPSTNNCVKPKNSQIIRFAGLKISTINQNTKKEEINDSDKLLCGELDVTDCNLDYNIGNNFYNHLMIICGKRKDVDACQGDSGGGMLDNANVLHGVLVTIGSKVCQSPVHFMDICSYRTWISKITNN